MKKLLLLIPVLLILGIFFTACQDEPSVVEPGRLNLIQIDELGGSCTPIFAGQNIEVGTVCLEDDFVNDQLTVTYTVTGGWSITEIHFVVKNESGQIPMTKKGNLIPGQFPYSYSFPTGVTTYSFTVPFSAFGGTPDCDDIADYFAAAHCVVTNGSQTETGWGNGSIRPGNSWGEIFSFKMVCETTTDYEETDETAFAYGCENATCFENIYGEDFQRWGWTNLLEEIGTYYFDIYAAAGQCNLTNGTLVGELIVEYDGTNASVTYTTCGDYKMTETHLYVGTEVLPKNNQGEFTIAPGQFPYTQTHSGGVNTYTYGPIAVTAPFYVVAHAVVEGDYTQGSCGEAGCDFVPPCTPAGLFYGTMVGTPERIYKVDVSTAIPVPTIIKEGLNDRSCSDDGNYPNGIAWDENNNIFIYAECDGSIWTYKEGDATSSELTIAYSAGTPALQGTNLPINGGTWYNGKYYFIEYNTNKLYEGVIVGNTITLKLLYNLTQTCGFFGDVAFDPEEAGIMYGWCEVGTAKVSTFFKVDIATGALTVIKNTGYTGIRQLAFAYTTDGWKLYTASAGTGVIATVDKTTGVETTYYTSAIKFTDLASGPKCK